MFPLSILVSKQMLRHFERNDTMQTFLNGLVAENMKKLYEDLAQFKLDRIQTSLLSAIIIFNPGRFNIMVKF